MSYFIAKNSIVAKVTFKSFYKTAFENCNFINKSLNESLPSLFSRWFKLLFEPHSHNTRANLGYLQIPFNQTKTYDRYSAIINGITYKVAIRISYFIS